MSATVRAPSRATPRRRVWIPRQHGAWAMLLVPILLGVAASQASPWHVVLGGAALAGYLASAAVQTWSRARRPPELVLPIVVYGAAFASLGLVLAIAFPSLLFVAIVALPATLVVVGGARPGTRRDVANSLAQVAQAVVLVAAAALVSGQLDPERVVVATKGGYAPGTGRPDVLRGQIETSLRRLRTDTIALYYLHRVDPETPLEESVGALRDAVERGQIRHVGLSQVGVEQIERARRIVPIAAVQNHYNLSERGWDGEVDYCAREGIVFVPYFPLRGDGGPELARIAQRHGVAPSRVVLAWLLHRSPTMLPIPGTLSIDHAKENLAALDLELTDEEFEALR